MSDYLPFLIFGISVGSLYGLSAMGLVLTYKTSGLFNIAQGSVAAAGAFAFYDFRDLHGLPWPVAALLSVFIFGPLLGIVLERMARFLAHVPTAQKIVATIGLLVAIRAIAVLRYGPEALTFEPFLPTDTAFKVQGVPVTYDKIIVLVLGIVAAVFLYLFFNRSRLGTAMRAVVDDSTLLDMTGISPARVRLSAWVIGSCFAAASGSLFAATQHQIDVDILSLLVIQAFGAAAIGRFTSLPMSFVGGLALGVLQAVASKAFGTHASLQGIAPNMPFIVLFGVLLFSNRARLVEVGREVKSRAVPASLFPGRVRALGYGALLTAALLVPTFAGTRLGFYNGAAASVVLFLSLSLLVRTSGQISLCHIGFSAIGAVGFAHALQHGVPWFVAVLLGGIVVVPVGAIIAIPAIRLSGLYLGLATLGFGILLAQYAYNRSYMFGIGLDTARPSGFDDDKRYYYLLLGIALLAIGLVVLVEQTRLGRLLRGLADSPVALTTLGTSVSSARIIVFCISAFLAGVSGATTASLLGSVNYDSFAPVSSLSILAILAISGRRTVTSAVVAALLFRVLPAYLTSEKANEYSYVAFGLAAIVVAAGSQEQLAPRVRQLLARRLPAAGAHASSRRRRANLDEPWPPGRSNTGSIEESSPAGAVPATAEPEQLRRVGA